MEIPHTSPMFSVALIGGIMLLAALLLALDYLRRSKANEVRDHRVVLDENGDCITHHRPDKEAQSINLRSLKRVSIEKTDNGHAKREQVILLEGLVSEGSIRMLIPHDAEGASDLWHRLFELPEFDHALYALAVDSGSDQRYTVWQRVE